MRSPAWAATMDAWGGRLLAALSDVAELAAIAKERKIGCHVDACLGGFVLPWAPQLLRPAALAAAPAVAHELFEQRPLECTCVCNTSCSSTYNVTGATVEEGVSAELRLWGILGASGVGVTGALTCLCRLVTRGSRPEPDFVREKGVRGGVLAIRG